MGDEYYSALASSCYAAPSKCISQGGMMSTKSTYSLGRSSFDYQSSWIGYSAKKFTNACPL